MPSASSRLAIEHAGLHLRLLELVGEGLHHLRGGADVLLAGDDGGLAGERCAEFGGNRAPSAAFFTRRVLDDVELGAGAAEALAQLGEFVHGQPGVVHHEQEGRGVHLLREGRRS